MVKHIHNKYGALTAIAVPRYGTGLVSDWLAPFGVCECEARDTAGVPPVPWLTFHGRAVGPLADYDVSGHRQVDPIAIDRLRHAQWDATWRSVAFSLVVHPFYGPCVPVLTNGDRLILWTGDDAVMVRRTSVVGPVGPWLTDIAEWNWTKNCARTRSLTDLQYEEQELLSQLGAVYWKDTETRRTRTVCPVTGQLTERNIEVSIPGRFVRYNNMTVERFNELWAALHKETEAQRRKRLLDEI